MGEWSHAQFEAAAAAVDRLLDGGRHAEAVAAAQAVLERGLAAGDDAYPVAAYDLAYAHWQLGRALRMSGGVQAALASLVEARERFQKLGEAGDKDAARMASASLLEAADCLRDLGQLDEAAATYERALEELEERRDVAVGKLQLGTVRLLQRKHQDALDAYTEARGLVEELGEPGSVAVAWHQIGVVHQNAGQLEASEHAYQQALKIKVQRGNRSGEAASLNQLGQLYSQMGRLEEAVSFYRQAAEIYSELDDLRYEGSARNNLADKLVRLERYDEARQEILRAIECKKGFGHAAEPWKTFMILSNLERAVGDDAAAAEARGRAIELYLAYRRDGGENHNPGGRLALAVAQALDAGEVEGVAAQLAELSEGAQPSRLSPSARPRPASHPGRLARRRPGVGSGARL